MALLKEKRQMEDEAKPFAETAMELLPSSRGSYWQLMRWLLPRVGKA
jgi:hypothetical protein